MEQSLCGPQNIWGMEAKDSLEDSIRPSMTLLSGSQARDVTLGTLSVNTRGLPCLTNQTYMYDQLSDSALLARWLPAYIQSTKSMNRLVWLEKRRVELAVMSKTGLAVDDSTRMEVKRRDLESVLREERRAQNQHLKCIYFLLKTQKP